MEDQSTCNECLTCCLLLLVVFDQNTHARSPRTCSHALNECGVQICTHNFMGYERHDYRHHLRYTVTCMYIIHYSPKFRPFGFNTTKYHFILLVHYNNSASAELDRIRERGFTRHQDCQELQLLSEGVVVRL